MLLLLDNYDSFTYNLYQYLAELQVEVEVCRNDAMSVEGIRRKDPRAIVLSPGPGRPEKAGIMNDLIQTCAGRIPILGVCLGHQGIAYVYGARITYAPSLMHGKTSDVCHDGSILFREIESPFVATRYHSLTVEPSTLPAEFKVTAWTADEVIMGLQHETLPLYGVQFHPESILTVDGKKILKNFIDTL